MKWFGGKESDNVEYGSGGSGGRLLGGGIGAAVIGLIIYLVTGQTPSQLGIDQQAPNTETVTHQQPAKGSMADFSAIVLRETEVVWDSIFTAMGKTYQKPVLHIFDNEVVSACGGASAATGPFYCPQDQKVYLDLSFFNELKQRFGAPGDFANAYVIAHEVGHHVQYLLGTTQKINQMSGRNATGAHSLSVALELQADFLCRRMGSL